jgi:lysine 2,3-aminomutase
VTIDKRSKATSTIRTPDALIEHGLITEDARAEIDRVAQQFAIAITPSVLDAIVTADPDRGVARQYVPSIAEKITTPSELADPIGDLAHSPITGIIHRYRDRVLLNVVKNCAVYCRFCFRREQVGPQSKALKPEELQNALQYIQEHKEIWEVILSGGDPLMLPAKQLTAIAATLAEMEHVRVMRIHTRVPAAAPERVTDDLIRALRVLTPTYVVVHINHPDELTDTVKATLARMADAGIPLLSQTVLLRHINDKAATLERLFRNLVEARVKPYYLHVADQAKGTSHFRTGIEAGQKIARDLRGDVSGLCQPTLVLDIPGGYGKVPVGPCYAKQAPNGCVVTDIKGKPHDYQPD